MQLLPAFASRHLLESSLCIMGLKPSNHRYLSPESVVPGLENTKARVPSLNQSDVWHDNQHAWWRYGLAQSRGLPNNSTSTCAEARGHVDRGQNPAHSGSVQHARLLEPRRISSSRRSGGGGVMGRCSDVSRGDGVRV